MEKKERARLKTVKFHARTGMIESNRVSGKGHFVPAPAPEQMSAELLLGSQGDGRPPSPPECGKQTSTSRPKQAKSSEVSVCRSSKDSEEKNLISNAAFTLSTTRKANLHPPHLFRRTANLLLNTYQKCVHKLLPCISGRSYCPVLSLIATWKH